MYHLEHMFLIMEDVHVPSRAHVPNYGGRACTI